MAYYTIVTLLMNSISNQNYKIYKKKKKIETC